MNDHLSWPAHFSRLFFPIPCALHLSTSSHFHLFICIAFLLIILLHGTFASELHIIACLLPSLSIFLHASTYFYLPAAGILQSADSAPWDFSITSRKEALSHCRLKSHKFARLSKPGPHLPQGLRRIPPSDLRRRPHLRRRPKDHGTPLADLSQGILIVVHRSV